MKSDDRVGVVVYPDSTYVSRIKADRHWQAKNQTLASSMYDPMIDSAMLGERNPWMIGCVVRGGSNEKEQGIDKACLSFFDQDQSS
jgi:hypothetical protein